MAQNITLLGASYSAVPAVNLPKTGGGTATFTDVTDTTAAAADVASGKYFYTAAGTRTQGTASGGGSGFTLLNTTSLGTLSTTATSGTDTGKSLSITGYNDYDVLIIDVSVDTLTNGRHTSTVSLIFCTGTSTVGTKNTFAVGSNKWNSKLSSSGAGSTRQSTSGYGVYAQSVTASNNKLTVPLYYRYNSNNTGTINNSYTARVYGVKLYDLIGG